MANNEWLKDYQQKINPQSLVGGGGTSNLGLGPTLSVNSVGDYNTDFWTPEQWQEFGANGGIVGSNGELIFGNGTSNELGTMDWLNKNQGGLGTIMKGAGLGLSAYDTFFGDTAKRNKKEMQ